MLIEFIMAVVVWLISVEVGGLNPILDAIIIGLVLVSYVLGSRYLEHNISE